MNTTYECDGCGACCRPVVCVAFPAGSEECQEARLSVGLLPLEPPVNP